MKVRIKGNFIRYRLSKSEVDKLAETGFIEEKTHISPGQTFEYKLQQKENIEILQADFINSKLTIYIPLSDSKQWNKTNKVGYRNTVNVDADNILVILIEKDFQCLDETEEDQSDNFPNPQASI